MTQEDRYHVNGIIKSVEAILSDKGTVIAPNLENDLKTALKRFERYELIKVYKAQERSLYAEKKYELYKQTKALRENLESADEL